MDLVTTRVEESVRQLHNMSQVGNDSINVINKGCFVYFDCTGCIRVTCLSFLMMLTLVICVIKISKLHLSVIPPTWHLFAIFYFAALECGVSVVNLMLARFVPVHFVVHYLKLLQLLVVCHLHWEMVARILRKGFLMNRLVIPILSFAFCALTSVVVIASVKAESTWVECLKPYQMALSAPELALVQFFLVSAVFIGRRLNEISTLECVRKKQKLHLWMLVLAFEISSLCGFAYDVVLKILADEINGCSGVFLHTQFIYTVVHSVLIVFKYIVPIWVMLHIFHPIQTVHNSDALLPAINEVHTAYTSTFATGHPRPGHFPSLLHPSRGRPGSDPSTLDPRDISPNQTPSPEVPSPIFAPRPRRTTSLAVIDEEDYEDTRAILY